MADDGVILSRKAFNRTRDAVEVVETLVRGHPPMRRRSPRPDTAASAARAAKAAAIWTTDGTDTGNGSFVNVNFAKLDGTGVITGDTVKVWLPRHGLRLDPNVQAGHIILIQPFAEGGWIAPSGYLDGKIDETFEWTTTLADHRDGWTLQTDAYNRVLIGADSAGNNPGDLAGTVANPPPWTSGVPSATEAFVPDTTGGPPPVSGTEDHTHDVDPDVYYLGYLWLRTS